MLKLAAFGAVGLALAERGLATATFVGQPASPDRPTADGALQLLMEGNQRWVATQMQRPNQSAERRTAVAGDQQPFAIVFSCIDSRVPPELVFDQGLGDIFVVRTAGHVIDDAALGSIEYGVEELHVPLLVVLGHESCGAVVASIETIEQGGTAPGHINALVEGIRPAVDRVHGMAGDTTDNAVRAHTELVVASLRGSEPILAHAVQDGALKIVGGRYDLASGRVDLIA
jgi:carbonic anhydrase